MLLRILLLLARSRFAAIALTAEEALAEEDQDEYANHDSSENDDDEVDLLKVPDIVFDLEVEALPTGNEGQTIVDVGEKENV